MDGWGVSDALAGAETNLAARRNDAVPSHIVTYTQRPKRPPRKRKGVAVTRLAIVRRVKTAALPTGGKPEPAAPPPPANDDRKPPRPGARKPAIVTSTSRKRVKLLRADEPDDPEAAARIRAWLEHAKWGRGPAR